MTARHHRRGDNPWQRDGRDPVARLRHKGRWEAEIRAEAIAAALRAWAIASLIALALILGAGLAAVHALGLDAPGAHADEGPASP